MVIEMKNILIFFMEDFKRIKTNVIAIVIALGLIVIPSLYAWFNILSNWDPYGEDATSRIKVAVASEDEGTELEGIEVNIGDKIISALQTNSSIGWVFLDTEREATDGVENGDYYAALVIPAGFSEDLVSFLSDNMTHPEICYYENQKKNAIAPKITAKAKTAVQSQVNATVVETLAQAMTGAAGTVMDTGRIDDEDVDESDTMVDILIRKLESVLEELDTYEELVDSFILVTDSISDTTEQAQDTGSVKEVLDKGQVTAGKAQDKLDNGISSKLGAAQSLSSCLASVQSLLNTLSNTYTNLQGDADKFNDSINEMGVNLHETKSLMNDMRSNVEEAISTLEDIKNHQDYQYLTQLISNDAGEFGKFISDPVELELIPMYEIENYGSAMSPFYTILALWVGALFLVAIIHVKVEPVEGMTSPKRYQAFFGRYITFFVISQFQALLTVLGDLYFTQIQCLHPVLLWLVCSMSSFVFSLFIYSLTAAMGNVGEAIAIIVMVIQVAGAGGTFPVEVLPDVYQLVYKFLPFNYAMNAMRECVGGFYGTYYWECLLKLAIYIPISLFIGLALGRLFEKFNEMIEKSKEDSGVML